MSGFRVGQECTVRIHEGRGKEHHHPATVTHVSRDGVRVAMHGETVWFPATYPDAKRIVKWKVTPAEALTSGLQRLGLPHQNGNTCTEGSIFPSIKEMDSIRR